MRPVAVPGVLAVLVGLAGSTARADITAEVEAARKAAPACDRTRAHCFLIQVHVAADDHGLVASADWIAGQLAVANRHFTALDVGFELGGIDTLPASAVHVETPKDRDALAVDRLGGRVIHAFIVGQLDNIDGEGVIFGVTWRLHRDDRKYVVVSAQAWERTLAHELGHFFGLPHSTYAISIMNKTERDEPPLEQRTFADEEITAMKPVLKRLVRDKVIVEVARNP